MSHSLHFFQGYTHTHITLSYPPLMNKYLSERQPHNLLAMPSQDKAMHWHMVVIEQPVTGQKRGV